MEYQNRTTLVSLNDSLLQCLSTKSINQNDIVVYNVKRVLEQQGMQNILPIDCGSLFLNKQHNITEFLKNNLSLAEIKATQRESIDASRQGLARYFISKKLKEYYPIKLEDNQINISDAIKNSKNVGVLLSCVGNDMMTSIWVNPIGHMFARLPFGDKDVLERVKILLANKKLRGEIVDGLKGNIEQILGINDNSKICTFGIYIPQILPRDFEFIFDEINDRIQSATKTYQQSYIDINDIKSRPIDFHPNKKAYNIIASRIADELEIRFNDRQIISNINVPTFKYQNLGLDGAIENTKAYYEREEEYICQFVKYIISNYDYTSDQIEKILSRFIIGRLSEVQNMEKVYSNSKQLIK